MKKDEKAHRGPGRPVGSRGRAFKPSPEVGYALEDAALKLGLSRSAFLGLRQQGLVAVSYVGNKPIISRAEFERFSKNLPNQPLKRSSQPATDASQVRAIDEASA